MKLATQLSALALIASTAIGQEARNPFVAAQVLFPSTTSIVRTGDFDGDGIVDAIGWYFVDSNFNTVKVTQMKGVGDGTFSSPTVLGTLGVSGQNLGWALETGSFDGNARTDYAFAFDAHVTVVRSAPGGGPIAYAGWTEPFTVRSMAVADFDSDGLDDIAVAGSGIELYRNTGSGFALLASFPTGVDIRAGEFDTAPGPDLLALNGGSVTVLSTAGGALNALTTIQHGIPITAGLHPVAGDIDSDGDDDIVVFANTNECVVLRQISPGTFVKEAKTVGGPATDFADIDGDGDLDGACCGSGGPYPVANEMASTYRVSLNDGTGNFALAYELSGFGAFRLAGAVDVDGDGDRDLVAGRCVVFNRGDWTHVQQPPASGLHNVVVASSDLERDGDLDFGRFGNTFYGLPQIWRNDGAGGFSSDVLNLPTTPGKTLHGPAYRGDFDGDGDDDLVAYEFAGFQFTGMRALLNLGGGDFVSGGYATDHTEPIESIGGGQSFDGPGVGISVDIDGDGDLDIVAGRTTGWNRCSVWRNDQNGGTSAIHFTKLTEILYLSRVCAVTDLDSDGNVDVVGGSIPFVGVAFGTGTGFLPVQFLQTHFDNTLDELAVADLDGDGRQDIAHYESVTAPSLVLWFQKTPRAFTKVAIDVGATSVSQFDSHRAFIADVDGDSDLDVIVDPVAATAVSGVLFNDGTGGFGTKIQVALSEPHAVVDLDGDGDLDTLGARTCLGAAHTALTHGYRHQYGASKKGYLGMTPTLGAVGPFVANSPIELRITGGRGGAPLVFLVGLDAANKPNFPAFGVTGYVYPAPIAVVLWLAGNPNYGGTGDLFVPLVVPPAASGITFFHQAIIADADAKPGLFSHTNGLELRYP